MDIQTYDKIYTALKTYNDGIVGIFGNDVLKLAPLEPKYPIAIFREIRNVAYAPYDTYFDRVSSLGYSLDIYAKNKGTHDRQEIARTIAQTLNFFLTEHVGLRQVSWNVDEIENEGSIYRIIITYSAYEHENRKRIY